MEAITQKDKLIALFKAWIHDAYFDREFGMVIPNPTRNYYVIMFAKQKINIRLGVLENDAHWDFYIQLARKSDEREVSYGRAERYYPSKYPIETEELSLNEYLPLRKLLIEKMAQLREKAVDDKNRTIDSLYNQTLYSQK